MTNHNSSTMFYDRLKVNIEHRLAKAIVEYASKFREEDNLARPEARGFVSVTGQGVKAIAKSEKFMYVTMNEQSSLKAIDFGLSGFLSPEERLNDIVRSPYYVAPEVLNRSYGTEVDMWSIGCDC